MSLSPTVPGASEWTARLGAALNPTSLELENQSHQHVGHAGHDGSGESHFALTIASPLFAGMNRVQRQRAVYAALGELMVDKVHALSIKALAPGE